MANVNSTGMSAQGSTRRDGPLLMTSSRNSNLTKRPSL